MRSAIALVLVAACSSASPEPTQTAKPRDAAVAQRPPPGQETSSLAEPRPCGVANGTTPPKPVVELAAGNESCARLGDGTVWCWGASGMSLVDADVLAPVACAVASRVETLGAVEDLWSAGRNTCVAVKGAVRCGRLTSGFHPQLIALDARAAFDWSGPCAITRDAKVRCVREEKTKEAAILAPVEAVAIEDNGFGSLCVLSRTAVTCARDGKAQVLASNVSQITAANNLWALRRDGTVVRLDTCNEGGTWKPCSVPVAGMRDAISIASGGATACVVQRDGRVVCVDCIAKTACTDDAKPVDGITDATQVAVGNGHACALRKTGEVVCWGASDCGQAGGTVEAGKVCTPNTVVPPTTITWAK